VRAPRLVRLELARIAQVLGAAVPVTEIRRILTGLGFLIGEHDDSRWVVSVPSWRNDVARDVDLVDVVEAERLDEVGAGDTQPRGQYPIRTPAGFDGGDPLQPAHQRHGTGEDDQRKRDLRHDESMPEALRSAAGGHALRILLQHVVDVGARRDPCGHGTEDQAGHHRAAKSECQRGWFQHDANARQVGELTGRDERRAPEREWNRDRAADHRHHQTVGEGLPEEPSFPAADRAANRELARPRGGARQLQVGQVHARDEQHQKRQCEGNVSVLPEMQPQYCDLVRAADVIIAKPGYGIVADIIAHKVPVLYVERDDFPESPYLIQALNDLATAEFLPVHDLLSGNIEPQLARLLTRDRYWPAVALNGARIAAEKIIALAGVASS